MEEEIMTDYQLNVILQLIVDKLEGCKTLDEYEKAKQEIVKMMENKRNSK